MLRLNHRCILGIMLFVFGLQIQAGLPLKSATKTINDFLETKKINKFQDLEFALINWSDEILAQNFNHMVSVFHLFADGHEPLPENTEDLRSLLQAINTFTQRVRAHPSLGTLHNRAAVTLIETNINMQARIPVFPSANLYQEAAFIMSLPLGSPDNLVAELLLHAALNPPYPLPAQYIQKESELALHYGAGNPSVLARIHLYLGILLFNYVAPTEAGNRLIVGNFQRAIAYGQQIGARDTVRAAYRRLAYFYRGTSDIAAWYAQPPSPTQPGTASIWRSNAVTDARPAEELIDRPAGGAGRGENDNEFPRVLVRAWAPPSSATTGVESDELEAAGATTMLSSEEPLIDWESIVTEPASSSIGLGFLLMGLPRLLMDKNTAWEW